MSSRRVEPQTSIVPEQQSIVPEAISKKQANDRGKEPVSGGYKDKETAGRLTLKADSLGLSEQTIKAVGKAKATKGKKKGGASIAKTTIREETSSAWASKLLKTVESLETDDPSSHLQSPESEPAGGVSATCPPRKMDAEVIVTKAINSPSQKAIEPPVPSLSEQTMGILHRLSQKHINNPPTGPGLPPEFKKLLQVFSQVESALPILLSRRSTPHMPVEILARHLEIDVNDFIVLLRKINGVWPEAVWLCWSDEQPEGNFSAVSADFRPEGRWNLQIGKGGIGDPSQLPSQRIGISRHSLAMVELRKTQFEVKLNELAQTKRGIPLSKLPQMPTTPTKPRQEVQKVKEFLFADESNTKLRQLQLEKRIQEISESSIVRESHTRNEVVPGLSQMTQNSLSFLQKSRKSPVPHEIHNTNSKETQSTQESAFLQSITEMIREKEEKIKVAREKYDTNAGHSRYSFEDLSQTVTSIKMTFTERQVSNLFLAQLIEKLSKATFRTISSGETCAKLEHIIEITKPWLTVLPRVEGALVRIDHKIPISQVIASLRQQQTPAKHC